MIIGLYLVVVRYILQTGAIPVNPTKKQLEGAGTQWQTTILQINF
ncbi:hypothetical protein AAHH67_25405 [Niallia circulans]